eukprot:264744-Pyramimonas_sp.AAC.1
MQVAQTWATISQAFGRAKYRWQRVRGPIAATVAVLMGLKIAPNSPVYQRLEDGAELRITDSAHPCMWPDFPVAASAHYLGSGLEGGVDFTVVGSF